MSEYPDPLAEILGRPSSPASDALRERLLHQTVRVVRWRRRCRRAAYAVALAACYVAGILTMRLAKPSEATPPVPEIADRTPPPEQSPAPSPPAPPRAAVAAVTARDLEWQAVEATERRAELFRLAGDRYLSEENDLASAVRCYKHALDYASPEDRKVSPNDNWLLMSLKNARLEANPNARIDG